MPNGNLAKNSHLAILAFLSLCVDFKNFFSKMTLGWVLWNSYYTLLLKKCLRPCPGLSMYLTERINWIISSFPRWISKILFVLGSWDHFGSLGCRIGECPFRYVLILFLGSVCKNQISSAMIYNIEQSRWKSHGPAKMPFRYVWSNCGPCILILISSEQGWTEPLGFTALFLLGEW